MRRYEGDCKEDGSRTEIIVRRNVTKMEMEEKGIVVTGIRINLYKMDRRQDCRKGRRVEVEPGKGRRVWEKREKLNMGTEKRKRDIRMERKVGRKG